MTLRLRLVLALLALTTVGLGVFAFVTYRVYVNAQYASIDRDVTDAAARLARAPRPSSPTRDPNRLPVGDPDRGGPAPTLWGARVSPNGAVTPAFGDEINAGPVLPASVAAGDLVTVADSEGNGEWRLSIAAVPDGTGDLVIAGLPLASYQDQLRQLLLIEAIAGATLLVILGVGSWSILRHGLRPLENMAGSAREITAGDLSHRVSPAEPRTEVGQLGLALNTMLDEIEAAFREREATEQRLRQFLADASHELRTPLTSIQGFAELVRVGAERAPSSAPDGRDHVDQAVIIRRIEEESSRMKDLVEDLLLLARLDQTRPGGREPVDLTILAADACSDAVALDPSRTITLDAPEPAVVLGDRDHLRQAIANLVTNAVRHTPTGSPIEVSSVLDAGVASVSVRDHGPGLDDEALAHAFDRFWQADRARVGHGAGLGLAIVAGIAGEHGGEITAANAPGGGAVFTLRFPLDARTPAPADVPTPVS